MNKAVNEDLMEIEIMSISKIVPYQNNAKLHPEFQIDQIVQSIKVFGFNDPIAIDENNVIIEGHGRLIAAEKMGLKEVPVFKLDHMSENQKRSYILAHNKLTMNTGFDEEMLKAELEALKEFNDIDLTGFDADELLDILDEDEHGIDEDEVPEVDEESDPIIKLGDLIELGEHRILCGDSTLDENFNKLMNKETSSMMITDPPYNLGFDYNSYDDKKTYNDYVEMMNKSIISRTISNKIITPGKQNLKLWLVNSIVTDIAVWYSKNKMSGGKISNLSLWEPIIFIGKFDRNSRANDIFEHTNERQCDTADHTCPKTVKLFTDIMAYADKKCMIFDPFLGSGTTLIACEKTKRKCYGIELDEHYCDVIISRYCKLVDNYEIKINGKNVTWENNGKA